MNEQKEYRRISYEPNHHGSSGIMVIDHKDVHAIVQRVYERGYEWLVCDVQLPSGEVVMWDVCGLKILVDDDGSPR